MGFTGTLGRAGVMASTIAVAFAFAQPAGAVTFNVVGQTSSDNTATVDFTYDAGLQKITVAIENTAAFDASITGFVFNTPGSVTGVSSFMANLVNDDSEDNWFAFFDPNDVGAPQNIGFFDVGAVTQNNPPDDNVVDEGDLNSGNGPNNGIQVGEIGTFMFTLEGDLGGLTANSFLSALSECENQGDCSPTFFAVRFQRTGENGQGSDVAVPSGVIPLPASLPLFLAGLAGLGLISRRRKAA